MRNAWKWAVAGGLLAYIYYPTFAWMVDRWSARDSYFGHGFLIPVISLYWIIKKRAQLSAAPQESDLRGLFIMVPALLLQIFASLLRIYFVSGFSFVFLLLGAALFLFGKKVFGQIWFPIGFLFLMIPLPLLVISEITLQMKFFVSEITAGLLSYIGIQTTRAGSYLYTPHAMIIVGDPCSGFRSFLAFLCLGLVFAYGSRVSFWKKSFLVFAGLPLALISNIGRVFALTVLAEIYGNPFIQGWVHDASGILMFVTALGVFLAMRKKLEAARA